MDQDQVLASLPPAVRAAIEARDQLAFQTAMEALPPEQLNAVVGQLRAAGIIGGAGIEAAQILQQFDPLLRDIAAVARGEPNAPRAEIEKFLQDLDAKGWRLFAPVQRIWNGEGDVNSLAAGLDEMHAVLIERILELIESPDAELESAEPPSPEEQHKMAQAMQAIAALPESLRVPLMAGDMNAFMKAIAQLPPEQQEKIAQQLAQAGVLGDDDEDAAPLDPKEVINSLPFDVRMAVEAHDTNGLRAALAKLPPAQAQDVVQRLTQAGIIGAPPKQERLNPKTVLNSLPFDVRMAVEARDMPGVQAALRMLPPAQAQEIVRKLRAAGLMG
ncbi:MAG: hypothetical protein HY868_25210 [Chloroflexi bacterium]|nr:hypothetical protein [Chloroflexota bacterium]